jgi:NAD(P)-dependent dehydrogenase (short-subunit alcohol dehydrogenase family)
MAQLFAREGAALAITDLDDQVWAREKDLRDQGHTVLAFQIDLSKLDPVKDMVRQVLDKFGQIDILANVAGRSIPPRPPFLEMSEEYWNIVMDRNLRTTVNCCWAVLPHMVQCKYGKVINVSSISGPKTAIRYAAPYSAAKGAVSALTRALALEMGEHNITVNAILPGDIDTEEKPWTPEDGRRDLGIFDPRLSCPIPRPGRSEEVADLALFLSTDESRFITGTEVVIDGGGTFVEPFVFPHFGRRTTNEAKLSS